MNNNLNSRADWLQRKGTFCVMCSRLVTKFLTISLKGGESLL